MCTLQQKMRHNCNSNYTDKIYVYEDITAYTRKIFNTTRNKMKNKLLTGVWTSHCKVVMKLVIGSTEQVKTFNELIALASLFSFVNFHFSDHLDTIFD